MTTPAVPPPRRLSREQREQIRARFEQLGGMVDDDAAALLADLDARDALLAEAPELIERLRRCHDLLDPLHQPNSWRATAEAADLLSSLLDTGAPHA